MKNNILRKIKKEDEYNWDLEAILENTTFEELKNDYLNKQEEIIKLFEINPFLNILNFENWHQIWEEMDIIESKLSSYISNNLNIDLSNNYFQNLQKQYDHIATAFYQKIATVNVLIQEHENIIRKYLEDKKFKYLTRTYELQFREKPHTLTKALEKFNAHYMPLDASYSDVFESLLDVEFKPQNPFNSQNKKFFLKSFSDYIKLMRSRDEILRKNTYHNWNNEILNHKNSFYKLLYYTFLKFNIEAKIFKYQDYIQSTCFHDEISIEFIHHIYKEVNKYKNNKYIYQQTWKKYLKYKYKIQKIRPWDVYLEIKPKTKKISIQEAQTITLNALKILGDEYVENIKIAFNEKWIDWKPKINKISGEYCNGTCKGLKKIYILLNYTNDLQSVYTLVHELGHAMHAVEYAKAQKYYSDTSIMCAEIASTVNEILLSYYLLEDYKNDFEKKLMVYTELIGNFFNSTVKQIVLSEFEYQTNKLINEKKAFDADIAAKLYYQLLQKYNVEKIKPFEKIKAYSKKMFYSVLTVPHFYAGNFYVYKYAIGMVVAILVANDIFYKKENVIQKYYQFLQSGCSKNNLETISILDIDLTKSDPWEQANKIVGEWIQEMKKLVNYLMTKKPLLKK